MIKKIILLLVSIYSFNVFAYDAKNQHYSRGVGTNSCEKMIGDLKNIPHAEKAYMQHIMGFSSGVNVSLIGKADFLENTDPTILYKFVHNYCQNNPKNAIHEAIAEMYIKYKNGVTWDGFQFDFAAKMLGQIKETDRQSVLVCQGEKSTIYPNYEDRANLRMFIYVVQYDSKPKTILSIGDLFFQYDEGVFLSDSSIVKATDQSTKIMLDITNVSKKAKGKRDNEIRDCRDNIVKKNISLDRNTGEINVIYSAGPCERNVVLKYKGVCLDVNKEASYLDISPRHKFLLK